MTLNPWAGGVEGGCASFSLGPELKIQENHFFYHTFVLIESIFFSIRIGFLRSAYKHPF